MTITTVAIIIFVVGALLKFIMVAIATVEEGYKPDYYKTPAATAIMFALFCKLARYNVGWYLMLCLVTIVVLSLANKFIFRSRIGGYIIASYIGMWLSTPYAVYIFFAQR